jgi:uncharacterized RDD family membrane protein YckC
MKYSPASATQRLVAVMLDGIIGLCAMAIVLMISAQKSLTQIYRTDFADDPQAAAELAPALLAMTVAGLSLPFLFALAVVRRGATPGKAMMSLTVRNLGNGAFPGYARAVGREILRFVHFAPFFFLAESPVIVCAVGFLVVLDMSRNRLSQTWYDRVTHTVIVAPVPESDERV